MLMALFEFVSFPPADGAVGRSADLARRPVVLAALLFALAACQSSGDVPADEGTAASNEAPAIEPAAQAPNESAAAPPGSGIATGTPFVVIRFPDGKGYPVTARAMTTKEKRRYRKWKER